MVDVPGTALLDELKKTTYDGVDTSKLKKAKDGHTILVPQPSKSVLRLL